MTPQEAIIKVRDDIITWCTNNFKKKADTTQVNSLEAAITPLETALDEDFVKSVTQGGNSGLLLAKFECNNPIRGSGGYVSVQAPTLAEHCANSELFVLVENVHYGSTKPTSPVNGQLFFLKVD